MTSKPFQLRVGLRRRATGDPSGGAEPSCPHSKLNRIQNRGDSTAIGRIAAILLATAATAVLWGCTNPGIPDRPPRSGVGEPVVTVTADWDDIDAAIARAAPRGAVALVAVDYEDKVERVVRLLAADGQTARVRFTSGGDDDPRPITLEASFGSPDDPRRSAALVRLIADELEALAGRAIAPR